MTVLAKPIEAPPFERPQIFQRPLGRLRKRVPALCQYLQNRFRRCRGIARRRPWPMVSKPGMHFAVPNLFALRSLSREPLPKTSK